MISKQKDPNIDVEAITQRYANIIKNNIDASKLSEEEKKISSLIYYNDLNSVKQRISDWVAARLSARYAFVPDWTDLIRVYDYVILDSHVTGIINGIKQKIKGKEFVLYNNDGDINHELTKELKTKWFSRYMDYFIETFFFPYTLIELGEYENNRFSNIQQIKREYVVPQWRAVKLYLHGTTSPLSQKHYPSMGTILDKSYVDKNSYLTQYFETDEYINDYIFVENPIHDLGLLDMAAPHALGKMGSYTFFLDYLQKFVIPFRHGQTDINDPLRRQNMVDMMENWGASGYSVTDLEDQLSLLSQSGTSIAPFTELFKYSNNEISKAFASSVGVFDEKNFVGSAEAGERMLDAIVQAYCTELTFNVNDELLPRLRIRDKRYLQIKEFDFVTKEVIPYAQRVEAIVKLAGIFNLDPEEVSEKVGMEILPNEIVEPDIVEVEKPLRKEAKKEAPSNAQKQAKQDDTANKVPIKAVFPIEMVNNAKRALKYAKIKNMDIGSNVCRIADIIINNKVDLVNSEILRILNEFREVNEPYTKSEMSVRFDLLGGKEGKQWALNQLKDK